MADEEITNASEGIALETLKFVTDDNTYVPLPQGIGLNDIVLVKKDDIQKTTLPQGIGISGITAIDEEGNEYYVLDSFSISSVLADNLAERNANEVAKEVTAYEVSKVNTELIEDATKDKFRVDLRYSDANVDKYNYDQNNNYAYGDAGVEIDGFLFFPEEVKGDESYARRDFNRTKIMSGGEFVTRGQYVPKEFSFTTTLDINPNKPYEYDKLFQIMENKACEIVSPYMGDIFKASVEIEKTHPRASPASLKLDIKIKEIVDPKTTVVGDTPIKYPSTNTIGDDAIDVRTLNKYNPNEISDEEKENAKIKEDSKKYYHDGREVTEDTDKLSNKNVNAWRETYGN